ncbi:MAG: hypothetical protein ACLR08_02660 [Dorea longicatena]
MEIQPSDIDQTVIQKAMEAATKMERVWKAGKDAVADMQTDYFSRSV